MMKKTKKSPKGISLAFTLLILVGVFSSVAVVFLAHFSEFSQHRRYENSLQIIYNEEAARQACIWEAAHAPTYNEWDTDTSNNNYDSICRLQGAEIKTLNGALFYTLSGYNFRVQVQNEASALDMYIHAYAGSLTDPKYSRYAHYRSAPVPLYKYYGFANTSLIFNYNYRYNCNGGRIHSNQDIELGILWMWDSDKGIRFNQLAEMTASGTIKYAIKEKYTSPYYTDRLDAFDPDENGPDWATEELPSIDGRAPAPYAPTDAKHYFTTDGIQVNPGPLRSWSTGGYYYYDRFWDGGELSGDVGGDYDGKWGVDSALHNTPLLWSGEESHFLGRQYQGSTFYRGVERIETTGKYLAKDGLVRDSIWGAQDRAHVFRYTLSGPNDNSLDREDDPNGKFCVANVMFRPYQDSAGNLNPDKWFEIPAALPQDHYWEDKYEGGGGNPVRFYATESCQSGNAGCHIENACCGASYTTGWRYIKKDPVDGHQLIPGIPADEATYQTSTVYIEAKDYNYGANNYLSYLRNVPGDRNEEFFDNYIYGEE